MNLVKNKIFIIQLNTDKAIQNLFAFLFAKDLIQLVLGTIISTVMVVYLILCFWKKMAPFW